jgi:catechol 2,3-dioxygenase-like lactoylglutathione lyase family enzyme
MNQRLCDGLGVMTDSDPLITGVDFVCIPAQDFEAMTAFYGGTLGLPFVKRYGNRPGAEYQAGNLTLAIMRTEDFGGTFSPNAMPIALQVRDVARVRERLEAKGVRFVSETFDSRVCWQAICLDPDGNPLSLHHRYAPKDARPAAQ